MIARLIATGFGCGLSPVAPGTAGSAAALGLAWIAHERLGWAGWHFAALSAAAFFPAVWAAEVTAREAGKKDPGMVVADEVVGQWMTLAGATVLNWKTWLAAFLLFRLFDIWKPPPVRRLEQLPGGLGIVADDAFAGVYGALVLFAAGCFNLY
jgi:phosphatidylglycerophosphatase A